MERWQNMHDKIDGLNIKTQGKPDMVINVLQLYNDK